MSVARALHEVRLCKVCRAEVWGAPSALSTVKCHTYSATAQQQEQLSWSKWPAWERLVVQGISAAPWERSCLWNTGTSWVLARCIQNVPIPVLPS